MANKTRSYREALLESLADPIEAKHYLNAAMDDSPEMFLKALRNVAQANQMTRVARVAGVAREALYRSLSDEGNPTLGTLVSVLQALGLKIAGVTDLVAVDKNTPTPAAHGLPTSQAGVEYTVIKLPTLGSGAARGLFSEYTATLSGGGAITYANLANSAVTSSSPATSPEDALNRLIRANLVYERKYGLGQDGTGSNGYPV